MLFKISVVVCLNILVILVSLIYRTLKRINRRSFIDKLQDYDKRRN